MSAWWGQSEHLSCQPGRGPQGTQLNALPEPVPVQTPPLHAAQLEHLAPPGHCASLVHQQGTPAEVHMPLCEDTLLQLPIEHDHALATDVAVSQSSASFGALPVHMPGAHWLFALTHFRLEQSASATHRHAVCAALATGVGVSVVVQDDPPPVVMHGTELGAGMQP